MRLLAPILALLIALAAGVSPLRAAVHVGEITPQQEELAKIKRSEQAFWELSKQVVEVWDKFDKSHDELRGLARLETVRPNVFLAVGLAMSEKGQRDMVGAYLDALGAQRFDEATRGNVAGSVLRAFHETESILAELDLALARHLGAPKGFAALCAVYPAMVNGLRDASGREPDVERHEAALRLVAFWREHQTALPAGGAGELAAALSTLVREAARFRDPDAWEAWVARVSGPEDPPRLTIEAAFRVSLDEARAEAERLRGERREEVRQLIALMRDAGNPPVLFLLKGDPEIRKTALVAIEGMSGGLAAEPRGEALGRLLAAVETREQEGVLDAALLRDALAGSAALARGTPEELRRRVGRLALAATEGEPRADLLRTRLAAIRASGFVEDFARLESFMTFACAEPRAAQPEWVDVRVALLEAAAVGAGGESLILRALRDPDAKVRGSAAATCTRLVKSVAAATDVDALGGLAAAMVEEKDGITRLRLVEAFGAVLAENPQRVGSDAVARIVESFRHDDLETRRRVAGVAERALGVEGLGDELRGTLLDAFRKALANGGGPEVKLATALALAAKPEPARREILETWILAQPALPAGARPVMGAILDAYGKEAPGLWSLAGRLAEKSEPSFAVAAALAGDRALALATAAPPVPLGVDLPVARDLVLRWREAGDDAQGWTVALAELDRRVTATPGNAALLRRRATLLDRLLGRAEDAAAADALRARLVADLTALAAPEAEGVDAAARVAATRRLARLHYESGRSAEAVALLEADAERGPKEEALAILARVDDSRSDARETLRRLEALDLAAAGWTEADRARVTAVLRAARAETWDPVAARAALEIVRDAGGNSFGALDELVSGAEALSALVAAVPVEGDAEAARAALAKSGVAAPRALVATLLAPDLDAARRRAIDAMLRRLVGADAALAALTAPEGDAPEAWAAHAAAVAEWWRGKRNDQKTLRAFLNGL
ncbi:MAG: hypothetical protein R3F20_08145 [Planctomycetota bacterium]